MTRSLNTTAALVTGASSGIGAEIARRLAARGADVVLVARRADRLETLAAELADRHGVAATALAVDLAATDAVERIVASTRGLAKPLGSLVNCAGFATHGRFADEDPSRIAEEIQVNVASVVGLTRALLPDLLATDRGFIVNVASTAGLQPVPKMAVYGATKAFVLSFTEALSAELGGTGLRAIALCPGATSTEFFDVVGTQEASVGQRQEVGAVVDELMSALDRRHPPASRVSGWLNRRQAAAVRLLPRPVALRLSARAMGV